MIVNAANDLKVESTTQSSSNTIGSSRFTRTGMDRIAGLYITGSNTYANSSTTPTLIATAGNNISLRGAQIINSGNGKTQIQAGQTIELATVTTSQDDNAVWDAKNHSRLANSQDIGTHIQSQVDIALESGRDITARAANITSQGGINVQAGRDLHLEAGQSHTINDQARHYTTSGTFSSTTTTTRDLFDQTTSVASTLSGNSVNTQAGRDTHVKGSTIVADADINVKAGRDIQVISDINTHSENHYKDEKTSGIMGSGGFGISIGSRELSNDQKNLRTTATASSIGSLGTNNSGNVYVDAGRHYQQTGSDVLAIKGDVNITAQQVDNLVIESLQDTSTYNSQQKNVGGSLSVGAGRVSGNINFNQSKVDSDYASVNQQSGLRAGDSGFNVNVKGDTTLHGGAITSTDKAVKDRNNNRYKKQ